MAEGGSETEAVIWESYGPLFCFEEREVFSPDLAEIEFYKDMRRDHPGSCVELGAGDCRLSRHLADDSLTIGLEPSAAMLREWPSGSFGGVSRVRARAQRIPLAGSSMDLVLFPYNGLHCILERPERLRVLREVAELLAPGGIFVSETCPQFDDRQDETGMVRYSYVKRGNSLRLVESISHDHCRGRILFDMTYTGTVVPGGRAEIRLELALISAGEMLEDIRRAGMEVLCVWGDYDRSPWDGESSPRLLVLAGRKTE